MRDFAGIARRCRHATSRNGSSGQTPWASLPRSYLLGRPQGCHRHTAAVLAHARFPIAEILDAIAILAHCQCEGRYMFRTGSPLVPDPDQAGWCRVQWNGRRKSTPTCASVDAQSRRLLNHRQICRVRACPRPCRPIQLAMVTGIHRWHWEVLGVQQCIRTGITDGGAIIPALPRCS